VTYGRRVLVHPDLPSLVGAVAARFLTKLVDLLEQRDEVHIALTGGTAGTDVLRGMAGSPMRDSIDWTRVHFWWGDERFVPKQDPDRNEKQARDALLTQLPTPEDHIHPFPASDEIADLDAAAAAYAEELARHANGEAAVPRFDITFLGVGPDGHVASLFPGFPNHEGPGTVIGVRDSPKPPPNRLSLTFPALNESTRIWLVLAGAEKASALGLALAGASPSEVPSAGVQGRKRTVYFVDQAAASQVPQNLIASQY
jgi:6-phosphogluconolactonase